jgi:S1-C subfamily serine protease
MEALLPHRGGPRKLGIRYQEISGQLAEYFQLSEGTGILVTEVDENGAAFKAGLKAGDVIVAFAGERIEGSRQFRRLVQRSDPGEQVAVELIRDGKRLELELEVGGEQESRRSGKEV